jgi:Ca-activated chloride channel family protein
MMELLWPWMLLALPAPLIVRMLIPRDQHREQAALKIPQLGQFEAERPSPVRAGSARWPFLLYLLAWCCLVIAAARPQWTGDPVELPVSGRDLMLAIDISKSMDHTISHNGFSVKRITVTKAVASEFIEKRIGDRIGLILFGDQAYVQAPLTFDRTTVITLLNEAVTGLAGNATAIGDAIGLAVKRLHKEREQDGDRSDAVNITEERVLILLTDGVSNRGELPPLRAAQLAASAGMKIYTIGIGRRGSRELDEATLQQIAAETGGQYFRAYTSEDLRNIYELLNQLEPVEKDVQSYRPVKSLYHVPLTASVLLSALLALLLYLPSPRRLGHSLVQRWQR